MLLRRAVFVLWAAPVLFIVGPLIAASCTVCSENDAGAGPCQNGDIVLLECEPVDGSTPDRYTDEACEALDTAESRMAPTPSDSQAPAIDAPAEGAALPSATPFTFTWHPQGLAYRIQPAPSQRGFEWRDDLARWSTLLPAAEAHCAPFGGVAYALVFRANNQQLLRVETANTSWTPEGDAWTRLRAAVGTISLTIEAARFASNAVTEGPVVSVTPRTFTIAP
jgi:hypothetical protein